MVLHISQPTMPPGKSFNDGGYRVTSCNTSYWQRQAAGVERFSFIHKRVTALAYDEQPKGCPGR